MPPTYRSKVKGQGHTKDKNVHNMLSHGDTPICQNLVCLCQRAKTSCQTQIHGENIILILRSKVKVIQSLWMYTTDRTMVIHPCAKYGKSMSNQKKIMGQTRICTDRRTDGQTEWFLYTPLKFVHWGYNKRINFLTFLDKFSLVISNCIMEINLFQYTRSKTI